MKSNMKSQYIQLDHGIKLHYNSLGTGDSILFLHGFPEFSGQWDKQVEYFSKAFHCFAPDLRGYNLSDKPDGIENYTVLELIKDLKNFIDKLNLKSLVLVGHDWGGIISWVFASIYPEMLSKLIILNAPHPAIYEREVHNNLLQQEVADYAVAFRRPTSAKLLARKNYFSLDLFFLEEGINSGYLAEADREKYHTAWGKDGALNSMLNYYRASNLELDENKKPNWSTFKLIKDFDCNKVTIETPTLLIWGEKDRSLMIENLNGIESYVPNIEIKKLPNNSHWLIQESPDEINSLIEEFITSSGENNDTEI